MGLFRRGAGIAAAAALAAPGTSWGHPSFEGLRSFDHVQSNAGE
jgi:hypothetical protein